MRRKVTVTGLGSESAFLTTCLWHRWASICTRKVKILLPTQGQGLQPQVCGGGRAGNKAAHWARASPGPARQGKHCQLKPPTPQHALGMLNRHLLEAGKGLSSHGTCRSGRRAGMGSLPPRKP